MCSESVIVWPVLVFEGACVHVCMHVCVCTHTYRNLLVSCIIFSFCVISNAIGYNLHVFAIEN